MAKVRLESQTRYFHLFHICWGDAAANFFTGVVRFTQPGMDQQLLKLSLLNYLSRITFCYVDDSKILKAVGIWLK